jgi:NADH-quinone oxidoreductase subunit M
MTSLALIVFLPLLAAAGLTLVPRDYRVVMRLVPLVVTFLVALLGLVVFLEFDPGQPGYQFESIVPWLGAEALGIRCRLGVDSLSVALVFMGAVVAFAAACASWEIESREKEFAVLLLVMTGGILGAFASVDLFFLYVFHEFALVPTFIMIGVWGRGERRNYATFKMTLYLSLGALITLIGLIALYAQAGATTFDLEALALQLSAHPLSPGVQHAIFPLLLLGFGILVSLWPFHTWAPLGYAAAPTPTAMLHAGVLKKFGLYGLLRVALPLLPAGAQDWLGWLVLLSLGNILASGFVAMRQKDLNLLIGNSSVAHMGFAFLGIASLSVVGVTGAVMVMVAHGFLAALAFGLSGYLHRQTGTLDLGQLGGLLHRLPFIGTALVMALLAGCGLPGFANFVGEIMVFFGAWAPWRLPTILAVWGGLIIGAVYMIRAVRHLLHGPLPERWATLADAPHLWRKLPFALLLACLLIFGCLPSFMIRRIEPAAINVVQQANPDQTVAALAHAQPSAGPGSGGPEAHLGPPLSP